MSIELARRTDPTTSHEAGRIIDESGRRETLKAICLRAIELFPGSTAGQVGELTGLGHEKVWRRISDLKNDGLIVADGTEAWHGRAQSKWWPAEQQ